jgi:hypothetical protein
MVYLQGAKQLCCRWLRVELPEHVDDGTVLALVADTAGRRVREGGWGGGLARSTQLHIRQDFVADEVHTRSCNSWLARDLHISSEKEWKQGGQQDKGCAAVLSAKLTSG